MSVERKIDYNITDEDLPQGWVVKDDYNETIRFKQKDSQNHIIIADWSDDNDKEYIVTPMVEIGNKGIKSESFKEYESSFCKIENAIQHGVKLIRAYSSGKISR